MPSDRRTAAAAVARRAPAGRRLRGAARPRGRRRRRPGAVGASGALESRAPESVTIEGPVPPAAAGDPGPARRPAVGAAEDRQRLRPPLLVLRHPDVPRRLRLPPPDRRHRRGPLAGRARRQGALPRQRELHVVRQGPRRPRPAREAAARAGRRRGHRAGAGVLPAAGRDPARPARRDGRRRPASCPTSTSPSSTPREPLLRRMRRFGVARGVPRPARPRARARPAGRHPLQRHRRLPRRDRGRRRRARGASSSPPASTSSACSATPTRTAPRPRPTTASCPTSVVAERLERSPALVEELNLQRAEERIGESVRRARRGDRRRGRRPRGVVGRAAHQGPDVDGVTLLHVPEGASVPRVGDLVTATVVGTEGIDLVAEPAMTAGDAPGVASRHGPGSAPSRRPARRQASAWNIANALTVLRIAARARLRLAAARSTAGTSRATASWPLGVFVAREHHRPDRRRHRPRAGGSSPTSARSATRSPTRP